MRRPEAERGSATTEVVLLTPVLLFLIMAIIQFGLWFHAQHVAQAAADQGVRTAAFERIHGRGGTPTRLLEDFLDDAAPTLIGDPVVVGAERERRGVGDRRRRGCRTGARTEPDRSCRGDQPRGTLLRGRP